MRTILVTGCNGGIGLEICKYFSQSHYILGIDLQEKGNKYVNFYQKLNLENISNNTVNKLKPLIRTIKKRSVNKKLELLVNNAALQIKKSLTEINNDEIYQIFNTNLISNVILIKNLIPVMKNSCIVNIGSIHANQTKKRFGLYAASKGGLKSLTKALSVELAPDIRVNMIEPAAIDTPMLKAYLNDQQYSELKKYHPTNTVGKPEEIAKLIKSINDNQFINGSIISIDGGISNVLFDPETEID